MVKYDTIAAHYAQRRNDTSRFDYNRDIEVPAMLKMLGDVKGKLILDMGCGFGDHAQRLAQEGAARVVGFDASKKLITLAREQRFSECKFEIGDMNRKLKYNNNHFDIVFSSLAVHYVKNLKRLFLQVRRVLKRGGIFVFSVGHPIFDLINQSHTHKIGVDKIGKKRIIHGNYFSEGWRSNDLGSLGEVKLYHHTLETFIASGLNNGFELIDYREAKPIPSSQKYDMQKYKLTTTLPTFILFKFRTR